MNSVVSVDPSDSIAVENEHDGRVQAQIPATLLLAADRVMRHCLVTRRSLLVSKRCDAEWEALIVGEHCYALGASPWEALKNLADKLETQS